MQKNIRLLKLLAVFFPISTFASTPASRPDGAGDFEKKCESLTKSRKADGARFKELVEIAWDHKMKEFPEWATEVGYPGQNDRWTDLSLETIARRKRETAAVLKTLSTIKPVKLSAADKVNYELFSWETKMDEASGRFSEELLPLSQLDGIHQNVPRMLELMPTRKVADYGDILVRLKNIPKLVEQTTALLKEGMRRGIVPPQVALREVPAQIDPLLSPELDKNPLLVPLKEFPSTISNSDRERIRAEALKTLKEEIIPAFQAFHTFIVATYLPACRATVAWKDLPEGEAWYNQRIRYFTTAEDLTPEKIHELGLSEVKRIRAEMENLVKQTGFKGTLPEFLEFLRRDSQFFFETGDELVSKYRDISKRIDPELIKLFGKLPRLPYGVKAVPQHIEKAQTTAYFQPGSLKAGRPGYFYANTYDLKARPKWEMEALTLHEAVPGHHLQLALAEEMEGVPEFRKNGNYTAFIEGWALYSEGLGSELGLYTDPYSRFGKLVGEMWRAVRLVIDTGLHAKGWTRQQAIDYFTSQCGRAAHDIEVEVDRYIVWAGQALAYKIGELKIQALKKEARNLLGDKFDIRAFHDAVLKNGSIPLTLLEREIRAWHRPK